MWQGCLSSIWKLKNADLFSFTAIIKPDFRETLFRISGFSFPETSILCITINFIYIMFVFFAKMIYLARSKSITMNQVEKAELRNLMREKRERLSVAEVENRSSVIIGKLEVMLEFLKAKTVLIYWSLPEEVQTHEFIGKWSDIKNFILPQVVGSKLVLRRHVPENGLKRGKKLNIMEPVGTVVHDYSIIDLAIIPGVAFDREGNRLGRGKAYYDKLLPNLADVPKVGVAFDFQVLKHIPVDPHDVKMDYVITD
jgi:5-formyltetrahydrofolate cyclo-ligase